MKCSQGHLSAGFPNRLSSNYSYCLSWFYHGSFCQINNFFNNFLYALFAKFVFH